MVDIIGYEGLYKIDRNGDIISFVKEKPKMLKHHIGQNGYPMVRLYKNEKSKAHYIHRLIGIHFIPNPEKHPVINHINAIRHDNRIENLEWCTESHNQLHKIKLGRGNNINRHKGSLSKQSKPIIALKDGNVVAKYDSIGEAKRALGFKTHANIVSVLTGKRSHCGGLTFQYDAA